MINFKSLLETVYEPKSGDEKNFKDKHVVVKYKTPYDSEPQFTSNKPKAKRKADHDKGEDEAVYEAAEVHTKRADKEAVIVRAVDPKTGESKARVVQRRAGEVKIGEEVEQIDELSKNTLKKYRSAAWNSAGDHYDATADAETDAEHDYHMGKGDKRMKGYELATAKTGLKPHQTYVDSGINTIPNAKVKATSSKMKKEEVEQIDELSDEKLQSYHAKAGADRLKAKAEVQKGMAAKKFTPASVQKTTDSYKRFIKRGKGMTAAANKMSEEVELEEGTVGHGKYTITTGPKMSGMGEGAPSHVVAKRAKMAKLGVPHHDDPGEYGHTVKVTVKNNDTGETTHHHVYQRDTDRGSKEALVSTRTVGTVRAKQKEHENVLHNYLSGKKVSSLKEDLDEKVTNPYAVGMAVAMKSTGDTPPLKKSTIVKGHEIAKSIKKEAMDPVGKHDADIDNDGDTDKSDKYLINRRKAIGKALRKEDLDEAIEVRHDRYMRSHGKKARDTGQSGNWMFTHKSMGDVDYNDEKQVHNARGKFADAKKSAQQWAKKHGHHSVYVMEEVEQIDEAPGKRVSSAYRMTVPLKDGQIHPDHAQKINDLKAKVRADNAKEGTKNKVILQGRLGKDNPNASKYKSKSTGKSFPGSHQRIKLGDASHADVYVREEVEMIDEAVKVGSMKLHDGSSVMVTRSMADSLNNVLEQLNPMNRVKMEQKLHTSKKDFDEILKFAENI